MAIPVRVIGPLSGLPRRIFGNGIGNTIVAATNERDE